MPLNSAQYTFKCRLCNEVVKVLDLDIFSFLVQFEP